MTISGLPELQDKFRDFSTEADQMIQDRIYDSTNANIVTVAKALSPKRTGALQASISAQRGTSPRSVLIIADRSYAVFLEYGTHHIPEGKFSFLRPAVAIGQERVMADLKTLFAEKLG